MKALDGQLSELAGIVRVSVVPQPEQLRVCVLVMLQRDQRAVDLGLDVRDVAAVVVLVLVADDDVAVSVVRGETVVEEFDERRALIAALRGISVAVFKQRRAALINCAAAQALEGVVVVADLRADGRVQRGQAAV